MSGCTCVNVPMGSYINQELRTYPFPTERFPIVGTKTVGIDRCILPDVETLWALGIETIESCCGHGVASGYIAAPERFADRMKALGYVPDRPERPDLFSWPPLSNNAYAGEMAWRAASALLARGGR